MIVLGSTGSIGVNTLNIAKRFSLPVETLTAGKNVDLLNKQIEEFNPKFVCINDEKLRKEVKHDRVFSTKEGILEAISQSESDLVINALVGFSGLAPSILTQKLGKRLALANKESLVVAGNLLDTSKIIPIDSEHFGLWYLLQNKIPHSMTITASGGAFRDTPLERLATMTPKEALQHPNWMMGKKITIDSATMTNKMFELLEARWLYGCEKLDAIIETKSIIHAMINFIDGSTTAHIANADMKLPISFALLGDVKEQILPHVDLSDIGSLEFRKIEENRFPIWEIKDDILKNPQRGVVLNASNEIAVAAFLNGEINILDIAKINKETYFHFQDADAKTLDEVFEIDKEVRIYLKKIKKDTREQY
ncbi:MAG: 1-deoxy-D-xylulose-5-phosphate reductoisomerase [Sulfurospirillaceae bacterium]|nr:1-deoxy-D-xylulose-5-phosphate reductoisomerase [Sulfurospirillaceae bacterium]